MAVEPEKKAEEFDPTRIPQPIGADEKPPVSEILGGPGTAVYGGFILEAEKDATLQGRAKYTTYSDILANTAIVAAGVRFFLNLVAKAGWKFDPADESPEAARLAELVDDIVHDMDTPWHRVVRRAAMFRLYGFGIQEWTAKLRKDGAIGFLDIEPRPQVTIERWDVDRTGKVFGVVQRNPQDGKDVYLPREKLVYLCDDSLNDSPEGLGLFRHLAKAARRLEKYELLEAWGFETDLRGIPVAKGPLAKLQSLVEEKKITPDRAAALRRPLELFIDKHRKSPSLGLLLDSATYRSEGEQKSPSGTPMWDVQLLQGQGGPHEEINAAIERVNRELARVLGVEHLLLGSDSVGSHALATDKTQSFGLIVDSTLVELREQFRKDIIGPLWKLNGWNPDLMPEIVIDAAQYRDLQQITAALSDLAKAGAPIAPNDPAINEIRKLAGLSDAPEQDMSLAAQPQIDPETGEPIEDDDGNQVDQNGNPIVAPALGEEPEPGVPGKPAPGAQAEKMPGAPGRPTPFIDAKRKPPGGNPFGKAIRHKPAGTPDGGQFMAGEGGGALGVPDGYLEQNGLTAQPVPKGGKPIGWSAAPGGFITIGYASNGTKVGSQIYAVVRNPATGNLGLLTAGKVKANKTKGR